MANSDTFIALNNPVEHLPIQQSLMQLRSPSVAYLTGGARSHICHVIGTYIDHWHIKLGHY